MMEDTMEDVLDDPDADEDEDHIVQQVLDEIGIDMSGNLMVAPKSVPVTTKVQEEEDPMKKSLEERLQNLLL